MKKVAFICTGNICRSPLAEIIFANYIKQHSLEKDFTHDSMGTHAYHVGERADPRSREEALKHGLKVTHKAKLLSLQDLVDFDYLIAMDQGHYQQMQRMAAQTHQDTNKVLLIRDFENDLKLKGRDVDDPYYGGKEGFSECYNILERCTPNLVTHIQNRTKQL